MKIILNAIKDLGFIGNSIKYAFNFFFITIKKFFNIQYLKDLYKEYKIKTNNLYQTNLKLVEYHLHNQSYSEALFRLKLIKRFKGVSFEYYYYLGIYYFYISGNKKNDQEKNMRLAGENFSQAMSLDSIDNENIKFFLTKDHDNIDLLPNDILNMHLDNMGRSWFKSYIGFGFIIKEIKNLYNDFFNHDSSNFCELGINGEINAGKLRLSGFKGNIDGIDISQNIIKKTYLNRFIEFNNIHHVDDYTLWLKEKVGQYKMVYSIESLIYFKDIKKYIEAGVNALTIDGIFVLSLRTDDIKFNIYQDTFNFTIEEVALLTQELTNVVLLKTIEYYIHKSITRKIKGILCIFKRKI
ncbi:MAG: hypothetical protein OEY79_00455 [Anaplasmataceae bacterium]|nr:hypothetical protein [Anaplasmataceae bacterium]